MEETTKATGAQSRQDSKRLWCRVAIIGAGASGLMCANELCKKFSREQRIGEEKAPIIVLEARDRIGGRIHSVQQQRRTVATGDGSDGKIVNVDFVVDNGAAWVHGTGYDWPAAETATEEETEEKKTLDQGLDREQNPMMGLLELATPKGQHVCHTHLNPISPHGNPWMRPKHALHKPGNVALYVAGERLLNDLPAIQKALKRHFDVLDKVSKVGVDMFEAGNGMDTVHQSLQETIDSVSQKHRSRKNTSDEEMVKTLTPLYQHLIEVWYACPPSDLQLCEFTEDAEFAHIETDEEYTAQGDFYGPHCTLRHGMKAVLEPLLLSDGVLDSIRSNQEVIQIQECSDGTVLIKTRSGLEVQADACVVTVPLGCLKDAIGSNKLFHPPLSQQKQEAINVLRMGCYKKVFMTFDRIFWPADEAFICLVRRMASNQADDCSDTELGNYLLLDNLWARDGIPCIEAVLCGHSGTWAMNKSDNVIRDAVLEFMQEAMGDDLALKDRCMDCHVTRWEEDKFSKGAYSSFGLGATDRHTEALRRTEWDGKLIFAGEATISEHEGSVHAALYSGQRAAKEVEKCLRLEAR